MATSKVIAGDFCGKQIAYGLGYMYIDCSVGLNIMKRRLDKEKVAFYEVVDTNNIGKSAAGVIGLSAVGAALVGPIGLLLGAGAKNRSLYHVVISFKDGKRSLLELTDRDYKNLIQYLFGLEYKG